MKVQLIAADSMGTRSMCTYVETDIKILIDPSVSLAPSRYGLPPHPLEEEKLKEDWQKILKLSEKAEVMIITHYHFDHFSWRHPEQFKDKILLIKHPKQNINRSQFGRASFFLSQIEGMPRKLEYIDGKSFDFGETKIICSKPVFHGTNNKLGYVVEVLIDYKGKKFLFMSDVEGPALQDQASFALQHKPEVIYIDGPMTYMLGYKYAMDNFRKTVENIRKFSEFAKTIIWDHHLTRDLHYKEKIKEAVDYAKDKGCKIVSAAEFMGQKDNLLEARRKELYGK